MPEWNVLIAATLPEHETDLTSRWEEKHADVIRELRLGIDNAGGQETFSTTFAGGAIETRFGIEAEDPIAAATEASQVWHEAAFKAGLGASVDQLDVRSDAALDRESERRRLPQLAGLAEVAERLGVSKGRVAALRKENPNFPQPLAHIKAGPIWASPGVEKFVSTWIRQPGRPTRDGSPRTKGPSGGGKKQRLSRTGKTHPGSRSMKERRGAD